MKKKIYTQPDIGIVNIEINIIALSVTNNKGKTNGNEDAILIKKHNQSWGNTWD